MINSIIISVGSTVVILGILLIIILISDSLKMSVANFLFSQIGLRKQLKKIHLRQKINSYQLDFLLMNSDRKMRKKWNRILLNPNSPFFIGDGSKPRIMYNNQYLISKGHKKALANIKFNTNKVSTKKYTT